ncbi:related to VPS8-vacuolar sorting protein, 134 kD [Rhynchosporium graminicola]|uniref:Related to VPS8-vacuolar sorting protein, 134 kD n=1 Tax=Rhynchosporium graminicola TaxID=2792576 RepID=A0A1E1KAX7_9HELO|nr:related to VPS8-vacuolar sorting protein, 134 kD [Rhynchosporium commune]
MSSSSVENDSGAEEATINGDELDGVELTPTRDTENNGRQTAGRVVEFLEEARDNDPTPEQLGNGTSQYKDAGQIDSPSEDESIDALPRRAGSPIDSLLSIPDDSPSVQGSVLSSPGGSSILPSVASRPGLESPTPSFRPFDRRFQSRLCSSNLSVPRASSPFLNSRSRTASLSSQIIPEPEDTDTPSPPWEVVRWTKLKKMNGQAFSEVGKRNFGSPTCISVSASIVLGTSKGIILIFDYHQNLKSIIGPGTKAVESGAITSVAISADHLIVAGGHANGSIFTWETARAARPFLHIPSLDSGQMIKRTIDGHVPDVAIRHLGFLGTRHTALVSADDRGMAFSHLATRGLGSVGRTVKTTRILGRYPNDLPTVGKVRKPSTVLAFAPLPLGNVERGTDSLGLTAMLTPYLLVIVSTTPIAQTQHKAARPKEVAAHSALSGCLAWFPAVKLKVRDPKTGSDVSKVKLVYCWSNVLTVLDADEVVSPDKDKPSSLSFKARSRWKAEEAIVAVQWLSRSVLTVLTITQRLIILEDGSMRMTEAFDLVHKHIFHQDIFSKQLHTLVEQLDEEDESMHGVAADAFCMSFKAYKSRMFLLGFNDVSIGTLSSWADRLIALMEDGDYIGAIQLATSYYTGAADKLTIGLPEDTALRHVMVKDKLVEIMTASLKFAFGQKQKRKVSTDEIPLKDLADACFEACLSIGDVDFLFEEAYEWYEDGDVEGIFLETLEPHILEKQITVVPPTVVKAMVTHYVTKGMESRLEEMICNMETMTLDIDQVTTLCKQHNLYDALIYIWNQALHDYITPLIDLLSLLIPLVQPGDYFTNGNVMEDPIYGVNALKMFPYISYTFTGRVYPTGEVLGDQEALDAKAELYWFIFSGRTITWPKNTGKPFLTQPTQEYEPSFPYLRMILKFDAPSFLSALNEAFEDSFLNDTPERAVNGGSNRDLSEEHVFGLSVNRQYVITILLEVMNHNDFVREDIIYLDMFIARNLPKFSQYLLLSGTALHKVLAGLCDYPGEDLADDAQLSAEYLLSVYHPPDLEGLIPLFRKASFYRVLKSIYKTDKQYGKLVQTYFDDSEDRDAVFDCIGECLRPRSGLTKRQIRDVHEVIEAHASDLMHLNAIKSAQAVESYAPALHQKFLDSQSHDSELQYIYLHTLFEPSEGHTNEAKGSRHPQFIEKYVQLMCKFDSTHVAAYMELVQASDLSLDKVLPYMEESGVIDAAVVLMAREGQLKEAMKRLIQHLKKLESAVLGLLNSSTEDLQSTHAGEAIEDLLEALQKYINVGIWLCQSHTKTPQSRSINSPIRKKTSPKTELLPDEALWLDLMDTSVQITTKLSASLSDLEDSDDIDREKLLAQLRTLVQRIFTALLTSTSSPSPSGASLSFLRILRMFLTRASISSPNLSDLRAVLASVFSAYAYEESILSLTNCLLDKDLFVNVQTAAALRQRGWRPRGSTCEGCGRRVWGPGVSGDVFSKWEEREENDVKRRKQRRSEQAGVELERGKGRAHVRNSSKLSVTEMGRGTGKGAGSEEGEGEGEQEEGIQQTNDAAAKVQPELGPLVVLACRHIYHQSCLEGVQADDVSEVEVSLEAYTGMSVALVRAVRDTSTAVAVPFPCQ